MRMSQEQVERRLAAILAADVVGARGHKSIVDELKVKLLPAEKKSIERSPTKYVEAYRDYLTGREMLHSMAKGSLISGRPMFARAIQLDPNHGRQQSRERKARRAVLVAANDHLTRL